MTKNIGKCDKNIRIVLGVLLIAIGVLMQNWIVGIIGLIPLGTGLLGWCPLYCPLKISTTCSKECDKSKDDKSEESKK